MPEIIPIRDLKNTNAISQRCHETAEPIFVTKNGYGDMVVMSMETYEKNMFVVATDVIGGIFAINQGKYCEDIGKVWYLAPDTLEWESLSFEYSEFIAWLAQGNINEFYQSMRWKNWRDLAINVEIDQGILIYPFLWSDEIIIQNATKKIVPFYELVSINMEYISKLGIND